MTNIEYEKLSETEHYNQSVLRQQFKIKTATYINISALVKMNVNNIYFEPVEKGGYRMRPIYREETDRQEWQDIQSSFTDDESRDVLTDILKQLSIEKFTQTRKENMTYEQYRHLPYEEYRKQQILKYKLNEMLDVEQEPCNRYIKLNYMLNKGVYLYKDTKYGYKLKPIIGKGNWTTEEWQEYRSKQLIKDKELTDSIAAILKKLATYEGKGVYICCGEKACTHVKCTCKGNIEECAKAAAYYEPKIAEQYEQIQRGENKSAAFEMVYVTTKTN